MRTAERLHSLPPSELIVSRIASHEGVDPLDLDVPLYEAIDPDALDALFGRGGTGTVEFVYDGIDVVVEFGPEVTVTVED